MVASRLPECSKKVLPAINAKEPKIKKICVHLRNLRIQSEKFVICIIPENK
jgi:hypothetical protein